MNAKKNENSPDIDQSQNIKNAFVKLLNPIPLIAIIILIAVMVLMAVNLFGLDKGHMIDRLSDIQYARGLITYIFAVGTIGAVIVLILAALLGDGTQHEKFGRAKEIVTILIGIFGTIIGFYFGSQIGYGEKTGSGFLNIKEPFVAETVESGEKFTYITFISGGNPPYYYSITFDKETKPEYKNNTKGWIKEELTAPTLNEDEKKTLRLYVKDYRDTKADSEIQILVKKKQE